MGWRAHSPERFWQTLVLSARAARVRLDRMPSWAAMPGAPGAVAGEQGSEWIAHGQDEGAEFLITAHDDRGGTGWVLQMPRHDATTGGAYGR